MKRFRAAGVVGSHEGWRAGLFCADGTFKPRGRPHTDQYAAWREAFDLASAERLPLSRPPPSNGAKPSSLRFYTGIGSRDTPPGQLSLMRTLAEALASKGWILRSGGAVGADMAFAEGAGDRADIYLPWDDFNGLRVGQNPGCRLPPDPGRSAAIAAKHHPVWAKLKPPMRALMGRNANQVLGDDLATPSVFVVCWAPKVKRDPQGRICNVDGGTGLAVRLAYARGVPVFHLGDKETLSRIHRFISKV